MSVHCLFSISEISIHRKLTPQHLQVLSGGPFCSEISVAHLPSLDVVGGARNSELMEFMDVQLQGGGQGEGPTVPRKSSGQPLTGSAESRRLSLLRKSEREHRFESSTTHPSHYSLHSFSPVILTPILHCWHSIFCECKMPSLLPLEGDMDPVSSTVP